MADSPFIVGAEVAIVSRSNWTSDVTYRKARIANVYKNGNFLIEGSPQQWKPGNGKAYRTGERGYIYDHIEPLSHQLEEEVRKTRLRQSFFRERDRIAKAKPKDDLSVDLIARLKALADDLSPQDEGVRAP